MWRRLVPLVAVLLALLQRTARVEAHGRLVEPPSRSSMWRYGFQTPPDYNDHELYCGGFSRQWQKNKGKCGICGDPWDTPQPRKHEAGGTYGTGTLVRRYGTGSVITIRVELTANHRGYFEFRLCPNNNPSVDPSQECLDRYVLRRGERAAGDHETRLYPGPGNQVFSGRYRLPRDVTCTQCVLQWRYIAGNNWGMCANGTGAVGCGPQEEFRACADVAIVDGEGEADDTPWTPSVPAPEDTGDEETPSSVERGPSALLVLLLVLCALAGTATALALLYLYFYHAGDHIKGWLAKRRGRHDTKTAAPAPHQVHAPPPPPAAAAPAPPPRHKRPSAPPPPSLWAPC